MFIQYAFRQHLINYTQTQSKIYALLNNDNFESLQHSHVQSCSQFIMNNEYKSNRIQVLIDTDILVKYVLWKTNSFSIKYQKNIEQQIFGQEQKLVEDSLQIHLRSIIKPIKKCRILYGKKFKIQFQNYGYFLKQIAKITDHLDLLIQIYQLANLIQLELNDSYSNICDHFNKFDQASILNIEPSQQYTPINPKFNIDTLNHQLHQDNLIDFKEVQFIGNCSISLRKYLKKLEKKGQYKHQFYELVTKYQYFRYLSQNNKMEQCFIRILLQRQLTRRKSDFEWFEWQYAYLRTQISNNLYQKIQEIYSEDNFDLSRIDNLRYYQNIKKKLNIQWFNIQKLQKIYTQKQFIKLSFYFYVVCKIKIMISQEDYIWYTQIYFKILDKFYQFLIDFLSFPDSYDNINFTVIRNRIKNYTFEETQKKKQLFYLFTSINKYHKNHLKIIGLLIEDILYADIDKEQQKDFKWRKKIFQENFQLFNQLMKCHNYKIYFVEEELHMFKKIFTQKKTVINQKIFEKIIQYFYPRKVLQDQIKQYFNEFIIIYGKQANFNEYQLGIFTIEQKINKFLDLIQKQKKNRIKLSQNISNISNIFLKVIIQEQFQSIINFHIQRIYTIFFQNTFLKKEQTVEFSLKLKQISKDSIFNNNSRFSFSSSFILQEFFQKGIIYFKTLKKNDWLFEKCLDQNEIRCLNLIIVQSINSNTKNFEQIQNYFWVSVLLKSLMDIDKDDYQLIKKQEIKDQIFENIWLIYENFQNSLNFFYRNYALKNKNPITQDQKVQLEFQFMNQIDSFTRIFENSLISNKIDRYKNGLVYHHITQLISDDQFKHFLFKFPQEKFLKKIKNSQIFVEKVQKLDQKLFITLIQSLISCKGYLLVHTIQQPLLWITIMTRILQIIKQYKKMDLNQQQYFYTYSIIDLYYEYYKSQYNVIFQRAKTKEQQKLYFELLEKYIQISNDKQGCLKLIQNLFESIQKQLGLKKVEGLIVDQSKFKREQFNKKWKQFKQDRIEINLNDLKEFIVNYHKILNKFRGFNFLEKLYRFSKKMKLDYQIIKLNISKVLKQQFNIQYQQYSQNIKPIFTVQNHQHKTNLSLNCLIYYYIIQNKQITIPLFQILTSSNLQFIQFQPKIITIIIKSNDQQLISKLYQNFSALIKIQLSKQKSNTKIQYLRWIIQTYLSCRYFLQLYNNKQCGQDGLNFQKLYNLNYFKNLTEDEISRILVLLNMKHQNIWYNIRYQISLNVKKYMNKYYYEYSGVDQLDNMQLINIYKSNRQSILSNLLDIYKIPELQSCVSSIIYKESSLISIKEIHADKFIIDLMFNCKKKYSLQDKILGQLFNNISKFPNLIKSLLKLQYIPTFISKLEFLQTFFIQIVQFVSLEMPSQFFHIIHTVINHLIQIQNDLFNQNILEIKRLIELLHQYLRHCFKINHNYYHNKYMQCYDKANILIDLYINKKNFSHLKFNFLEKIDMYQLLKVLYSLQLKIIIYNKFKMYYDVEQISIQFDIFSSQTIFKDQNLSNKVKFKQQIIKSEVQVQDKNNLIRQLFSKNIFKQDQQQNIQNENKQNQNILETYKEFLPSEIRYAIMPDQQFQKEFKQKIEEEFQYLELQIDYDQFKKICKLTKQDMLQILQNQYNCRKQIKKIIEQKMRERRKQIKCIIQKVQLYELNKQMLGDLQILKNKIVDAYELIKFGQNNIILICLTKLLQHLKFDKILKEKINLVLNLYGFEKLEIKQNEIQSVKVNQSQTKNQKINQQIRSQESKKISQQKMTQEQKKSNSQLQQIIKKCQSNQQKSCQQQKQKIQLVEQKIQISQITLQNLQAKQQTTEKLVDLSKKDQQFVTNILQTIKQFLRTTQFRNQIKQFSDQKTIFYCFILNNRSKLDNIMYLQPKNILKIFNLIWRIIISVYLEDNIINIEMFKNENDYRNKNQKPYTKILKESQIPILYLSNINTTHLIKKVDKSNPQKVFIQTQLSYISVKYFEHSKQNYSILNTIDLIVKVQNKQSHRIKTIIQYFQQIIQQEIKNQYIVIPSQTKQLSQILLEKYLLLANSKYLSVFNDSLYQTAYFEKIFNEQQLKQFYTEAVRVNLKANLNSVLALRQNFSFAKSKKLKEYDFTNIFENSDVIVSGSDITTLFENNTSLKKYYSNIKDKCKQQIISYIKEFINLQIFERQYIQSTEIKGNLSQLFKLLNVDIKQKINQLILNRNQRLEINNHLQQPYKTTHQIQKYISYADPILNQILQFLLPLNQQDFQHFQGIIIYDTKFILLCSQQNKYSLYQSFIQQTEARVIKIRRQQVWLSTVNYFLEIDPISIRNYEFQIQFEGQIGIDGGGPFNEWVLKIFEQIFNPSYGFFVQTKQYFLMPNSISKYIFGYKFQYRILGRLLAKFLTLNIIPKTVPLCKYIFKLLLGQSLVIQDIKDYSIQIYNHLKWVENNNISDDLDLTFSEHIQNLGIIQQVEFIENGSKLLLTEQNKHKYIELYIKQKLINPIKEQLLEFVLGFRQVFPLELLKFYSLEQINKSFNTKTKLNVDQYKKHVTLYHCSLQTDEIKWLFQIISQFNQIQCQKYLQFVTGRKQLSWEGFTRFKIYLQCQSNILPQASTCSSKITLGLYKSKQILKQKLEIAFRQCEGFHNY